MQPAGKESRLEATGFHCCFSQMMVSYWILWARPSAHTGTFCRWNENHRLAWPWFLTEKRWGQPMPQVKGFKYVCFLFTIDGRMEREIDRWISAVMMSVAVKKELSGKAKLSIY